MRRLLWIPIVLLGCSSTDEGKSNLDAAGPDGAAADAKVSDAPGADKSPPKDVGSEAGSDADPVADAGPDGNPPLECFELSLDPDMPLAIDGVFGATSELWRRPHDEDPVCPATALMPIDKAKVPFVAYAFCNNDSKPHSVDIEMISSDGPNGEAALDDPYLVLYEGKKIADDPLQCLAINDTIPDAMETNDAEILGVEVPPGGAFTVVGTTFTFDPTDATGTGYYIIVVTVNDP